MILLANLSNYLKKCGISLIIIIINEQLILSEIKVIKHKTNESFFITHRPSGSVARSLTGRILSQS